MWELTILSKTMKYHQNPIKDASLLYARYESTGISSPHITITNKEKVQLWRLDFVFLSCASQILLKSQTLLLKEKREVEYARKILNNICCNTLKSSHCVLPTQEAIVHYSVHPGTPFWWVFFLSMICTTSLYHCRYLEMGKKLYMLPSSWSCPVLCLTWDNYN